MDAKIKLNRQRYKVWQLVKIDEGDTPTLIDVMAAMLVNPETDEYYPKEQAKQAIMDLDGETFDQLQIQFYQDMAEARRATLPPQLRGR